MAKFDWNEITESEQAKLRETFVAESKKHRSTPDELLETLQSPDMQKFIEEMPKTKRAFHVFSFFKRLPVSTLCGVYHISEGYFRELRLHHRQEWIQQKQDETDEWFQAAVEFANDTAFSDEDWEAVFGVLNRRLFVL